MLIHSVYFWLKPGLNDAEKADFGRGLQSLAAIKSVDEVYIGFPAATPKRPVIDDSYSYALIVFCRDLAAQDTYQSDPIHLKFIADCRQYWDRVQIYDTLSTTT